jgi:hypothetical protein
MECFWQATDQCDKIQKKIPVHLVLGSATGKGGDVMCVPAVTIFDVEFDLKFMRAGCQL